MKKSFLTLAMLCLFSVGFVSQVNALPVNCNAAQIAAYDGAMGAGVSESQAIDIADGVYKACAGIE